MPPAERQVLSAERTPNRMGQWWLDRSVRSKALVVLAVPLVALVGIAAASLALQHEERYERALALKDVNVVDAAGQVLDDALNAETAVRGYVATGNPTFLRPYSAGVRRFPRDTRKLRVVMAAYGDVRGQRAVVATAGRALAQLTAMVHDTARGEPASGLEGPMESARTTVDALSRQVSALVKGPALSVIMRRNATTSLETANGRLDIAGIVAGLLAGLAGVALFIWGITGRLRLAAENARRLGEGRPLLPAPRSRDEIGRLACSMIRAEGLLASRAAELTSARDDALRATEAKNTFLSSTSHELRTPLNSILGFTQLLEMSDLEADDRDGVERILAAGRHLLALINELIDIARIESGEMSLSVEPVAVGPLLEEAATLMAPLAARRSIRIARDSTCQSLAAYADRQRFSQVLVNLISNAVKYNRLGGSITVTCLPLSAEQISVTVTDTGRGIAPGDLERIFIPFERLGADQSAVEGTGIGLPLARALTEAMGGHLVVTSTPGEGSAFTVTLARAADIDAEAVDAGRQGTSLAVPRQARSMLRPGKHLLVLYIEDNPTNIEVVSRFLRARPEVRFASTTSGQAGYAYAVRNQPDAVLLDLHLQDVHGEDVLNDLRAEPSTAGIPVVILSADASQGVIKRLLANGAFAYLTKPLDLAELGRVLDSLAAPDPQPAGARPGG